MNGPIWTRERLCYDLNTMFMYSGKAVYTLRRLSLPKFTVMTKLCKETLYALLTIQAEAKGW